MTEQLNFKNMSDDVLIEKLKTLVQLEKRTTAEIIDYIRHVDSRRLYLKLGHTSLFSFLTKDLGYTPASAQRRIDVARIMETLPEIKSDLNTGTLNLLQVSMVAQSIRQKQRELPTFKFASTDKKYLIEQVKSLDIAATQKKLAQSLNLEIKSFEKQRIQRDDSVRLEITFTKSQMDKINRAKQLLSHKNPSANWAELFCELAEQLIRRKDLSQKKRNQPRQKSTSIMEVSPRHQPAICQTRRAIPASIKRQVFSRDQGCQWSERNSRRKCGSQFQLQIDHVQPVWAGGSDLPENLRLLCSIHNRQKYQMEAGISPSR